jgi:hypothetical protein
MNTLQIDHALRSCSSWQERARNIFRGTFAINQVPWVYTLNAPFGLVVNTEPSSQAGDHWIALFQSEKTQPVEILDTRGYSYSKELLSARENYIHHLLDVLMIDDYQINRLPLQSPCSSLCGEYCILFLYCRMMLGLSFESYLSLFSETDLYENDRFVLHFVHQHFEILNYDRETPALYSKKVCYQTAKPWQSK